MIASREALERFYGLRLIDGVTSALRSRKECRERHHRSGKDRCSEAGLCRAHRRVSLTIRQERATSMQIKTSEVVLNLLCIHRS